MPKGAGVKETLCTICEHKDVCAFYFHTDILPSVEPRP